MVIDGMEKAIFKFNTIKNAFVLSVVFLFIISSTAYPRDFCHDDKKMLQGKVNALYEDNAALLDEVLRLKRDKKRIKDKFYKEIDSVKREVEELQFDSKGQKKSSRTIHLLTNLRKALVASKRESAVFKKTLTLSKKEKQGLENSLKKEVLALTREKANLKSKLDRYIALAKRRSGSKEVQLMEDLLVLESEKNVVIDKLSREIHTLKSRKSILEQTLTDKTRSLERYPGSDVNTLRTKLAELLAEKKNLQRRIEKSSYKFIFLERAVRNLEARSITEIARVKSNRKRIETELKSDIFFLKNKLESAVSIQRDTEYRLEGQLKNLKHKKFISDEEAKTQSQITAKEKSALEDRLRISNSKFIVLERNKRETENKLISEIERINREKADYQSRLRVQTVSLKDELDKVRNQLLFLDQSKDNIETELNRQVTVLRSEKDKSERESKAALNQLKAERQVLDEQYAESDFLKKRVETKLRDIEYRFTNLKKEKKDSDDYASRMRGVEYKLTSVEKEIEKREEDIRKLKEEKGRVRSGFITQIVAFKKDISGLKGLLADLETKKQDDERRLKDRNTILEIEKEDLAIKLKRATSKFISLQKALKVVEGAVKIELVKVGSAKAQLQQQLNSEIYSLKDKQVELKNKLVNLKQVKKTLEESLNKKIIFITKENEQTRKQQELDIDRLRKSNILLEDQIKGLEHSEGQARSKLRNSEYKTAILKDKKNNTEKILKRELVKLDDKIKEDKGKFNLRIKVLKESNYQLQGQISTIKNKKKILEEKLEEKITILKAENKTFDQQLKSANSKYNVLEKTKQNIENKLVSKIELITNKKTQEQARLNSQITSLETDNKQFEEQVVGLEKEKIYLNAILVGKTSVLSKAENSLKSDKLKNENLTKRIENLVAEKSKIAANLKNIEMSLNNRIITLEREKKTLTRDSVLKISNINSLKMKSEQQLNSEVVSLKQIKEKLTGDLANLIEENENNINEIKSKDNVLSELRTQLRVKEKAFNFEIDRHVIALEKQNKNFQAKFNSQSSTAQNEKNRLQRQLQIQISSLESKVGGLDKQIADLTVQKADLENSLDSQLKTNKETKNKLSIQISALRKQRRDSDTISARKIRELESQKNSDESRLSASNSKLSALESAKENIENQSNEQINLLKQSKQELSVKLAFLERSSKDKENRLTNEVNSLLKENKAKVASLTNKINNLSKGKISSEDNLNRQIISLKEGKASLVESLRSQLSTLAKSKKDGETDYLFQLSEQKASAQSLQRELKEEARVLETELRGINEANKKTIYRLEKEVKINNSKNSKLSEKNNFLESAKLNLDRDLKQVQSKLSNLEKEKQQFESRLNAQEQRTESVKNSLQNQYQFQITSLESRQAASKNEIVSLTAGKIRLNSELKKKISEVQKAISDSKDSSLAFDMRSKKKDSYFETESRNKQIAFDKKIKAKEIELKNEQKNKLSEVTKLQTQLKQKDLERASKLKSQELINSRKLNRQLVDFKREKSVLQSGFDNQVKMSLSEVKNLEKQLKQKDLEMASKFKNQELIYNRDLKVKVAELEKKARVASVKSNNLKNKLSVINIKFVTLQRNKQLTESKLKQELRQLSKDRAKLQSDLSSKEVMLRKVKVESSNNVSGVQSEKQRMQAQLNSQIKLLKSEISKSKNKILLLEQVKNDLSFSLKAAYSDIESLKNPQEDLNSQLKSDLIQFKSKSSKAVSSLRRQVGLLRNSNEKLEMQLKALSESKRINEGELRGKLSGLSQERTQVQSRLNREVVSLKKIIVSLKVKLEALRQEKEIIEKGNRDQVKKQLVTERARNSKVQKNLKVQVAVLKDKYSAAQKKLLNLKRDNEGLQRKVKSSNALIEGGLAKDMDVLKFQKQKLEQKIAILERSRRASEIQKANELTEFFNSIISDIKNDKIKSETRLKSQIVFLEDTESMLENELAVLKKEKKQIGLTLSQEIERLKREILDLRTE